ncbi:MAG: hypothetical protein ACJ8GW_03640 [Massilia sp.]
MGLSTLELAVLILAICVAINLQLSIKLLAMLRALPQEAQVLPIGLPLPTTQGRLLADGAPLTLPLAERAAVLLFLSSKCPKCKEKLPLLTSLLPLAQEAGVDMLLPSLESAWRLRRFIGPELAAHTLLLKKAAYKALNPMLQTPNYTFVGAEGEVEAVGMIGDEDWLAFQAQLQEIGAGAELAA